MTACHLLISASVDGRFLGVSHTVTHPNLQLITEPIEETVYCHFFRLLYVKFRRTIFAFLSCYYVTRSKMSGNGLESVANSEDWNAELEDSTRNFSLEISGGKGWVYAGSAFGASFSYIEYGDPERIIPVAMSLDLVCRTERFEPFGFQDNSLTLAVLRSISIPSPGSQ